MHKKRVGLDSVQTINIPPSNLYHEYRSSNNNIQKAVEAGKEAYERSVKTFCEDFNREKFDKYNGNDASLMLPIMHRDSQMKEVFNLLGLPPTHIDKLYLPWWNEEAGNHISTEITGDVVRVILGPRHSYQSQLMRQGIRIPGVASVTVAGFVESSDGKLIIGLRGGLNFPNTYYFCAGGLELTAELKENSTSIYDMFLTNELGPEYGLSKGDIVSAKLLNRAVCHGGDNDVSFVFLVKSNLGHKELLLKHEQNVHQDRKEHFRLVAIENSKEGIRDFVCKFYYGVVENRTDRKDNERLLLPQGAGPLLNHAGLWLGRMEMLSERQVSWKKWGN